MSKVNPYTTAICNCLENLDKPFEEASKDCSTVQFLTNMVQGRMLDHLVCGIAKHYQIADSSFEKELATILIEVFSDGLFAKFRQKIEEKPELIFQIAQRIDHVENCKEPKNALNEKRSNRFFINILCHHLEIDHMDELINTLNSNTKIQQLISSALIKKYLIWLIASGAPLPNQNPASARVS
ncbi:MAG: hypothetical protein HQM13_22300 [SAR324 cluster bacterium]|nr:hypothetical protein [SAR324 cluster bacterium]